MITKCQEQQSKYGPLQKQFRQLENNSHSHCAFAFQYFNHCYCKIIHKSSSCLKTKSLSGTILSIQTDVFPFLWVTESLRSGILGSVHSNTISLAPVVGQSKTLQSGTCLTYVEGVFPHTPSGVISLQVSHLLLKRDQ